MMNCNECKPADFPCQISRECKRERRAQKSNGRILHTDRERLEWLVWWCLKQDEPCISIGRGKELLNFTYMEDMREWYQRYCQECAK